MNSPRIRSVALVLMLVVACVVSHAAPVFAQVKPEAALRAAMDKETVDGDLRAAIALYRKLADGADRTVAAQALVRLGQCYEKLGATEGAEARKAYERLVRDFADQKSAADQARVRLAALGAAGAVASPAEAALRRVWQGTDRLNPRIRRDGRSAVFMTKAKSGFLTVRDLATGAERAIPFPEASGAGGMILGDVSPDGRRLAYAYDTEAAGNVHCSIRVVSLEGGAPREVIAQDGQIGIGVEWFDDGTRLLVESVSAAGAIKVVVLTVADGNVVDLPFAFPAANTGKKVEEPSGRTTSPDGRSVLATEVTGGKQVIVAFDTKTGAKTPLTDGSADSHGPLWTPDGAGIVFLRDTGGVRSLWRVRVENGTAQGQPELVKSAVGDITPLQITRDGTFYYWRSSQVMELFLARLDGAGANVVGAPAKLPGFNYSCGVSWSPDSSAVVYAARLATDGNNEAGPCPLLVIRTLDNGRERVLSPGIDSVSFPQWSPDGKRVLVHGIKDGMHALYSVDAVTGVAAMLLANGTNPTNEAAHDYWLYGFWAPDSRSFYWVRRGDRGRYTLLSHDLATGTDREIYTVPAGQNVWPSCTSVSRDGSVALFGWTTAQNQNFVTVIPADGGPAQTAYQTSPSTRLSVAIFSADGKSVWVSRRKPTPELPDQRELLRVPLSGGDAVYAGLTVPYGGAAIWPSPDGTRLLLGAWPTIDELWAQANILPAPKK